MKNIRLFLSENFHFLVVKFSGSFGNVIGYRNFINDLIKRVLLLILVRVRLLFCPNC